MLDYELWDKKNLFSGFLSARNSVKSAHNFVLDSFSYVNFLKVTYSIWKFNILFIRLI